MSSVRISRQQWEGLLGELDVARRQRHLLTYRALLERLELPSPAYIVGAIVFGLIGMAVYWHGKRAQQRVGLARALATRDERSRRIVQARRRAAEGAVAAADESL